MMNRKLNMAVATLAVGTLFAGCSDRETRVENAPTPLPPSSTMSSENVTPAPDARAAGEAATVAPPSTAGTTTTYDSGITTSSGTVAGVPAATGTTGSGTAAINADSKEFQDLKQEIVLLRSRVAELERTKDTTAAGSAATTGVGGSASGAPAGTSATSGVGGTSGSGLGGVTASTRSGLDSATTAGVSGGDEVRSLKQELETLRQRVEALERGRAGGGGGSLSGVR